MVRGARRSRAEERGGGRITELRGSWRKPIMGETNSFEPIHALRRRPEDAVMARDKSEITETNF